MELERCSKCTLPETWENISFDDEGVCNVCRNWDVKQKEIDWVEREKMLIKVFDEAKAKNTRYDCIIPFSGGKDSTFTLWKVIKDYGVNPLVVSFDHCFFRPRTIANRIRTFRKLGVDIITFTPNWHIVKKTMLESLKRTGDFCWHCHAGVFVYPVQVAVRYEIPLVIWGECPGEYDTSEKDSNYGDLSNRYEWLDPKTNLGIMAEDMAKYIGVELRKLEPYIYPKMEELENIRNIHLGCYIEWNTKKQAKIIRKELGWQYDEIESGYPDELTYEKIECMFTGVRDYIKYIKRGIARLTQLTSLDIRHGRMSREQAMEIINQYEGMKPRSLEVFLDYIGISEAEFNEMCLMHVIAPAKSIDPNSLSEGAKLWDQDLWYKENNRLD